LSTLSAPPVIICLPSDFQSTAITWCVWPSKDRSSLPSATFVTFRNLSAAAEASFVPSGLNRRAKTVSEWSVSCDRTSSPLAISQILSSPERDGSPPPAASCFPSGLKSSASTRSTCGVSIFFSAQVPENVQVLRVESAEAESRLPSTVKATLRIGWMAPPPGAV
jgi:hypothetical protein